jgi:PAS domain S-box-containing protein
METAAELKAILAASMDAIFTKTLDNVVTSWSTGATQMYGYDSDEIIGRPVALLVPEDRQGEIDEINNRLREGNSVSLETVRLAKDGREIPVALTVTPVRGANGEVVKGVSLARDLTALRQAERDVALMQSKEVERSVVLETANRVALDILSSRAGVEALSHIADAARTLANARYAALGVARTDGPGLQEFVTVGLTTEEERVIGPRPHGAGVLGLLLTCTEPLRISALSKHPASAGFPANHPVMESFLGVPIRRGETVFGSLYLTEKIGGGDFTEQDEIAVHALAAHAAVAIHNLFMMSRQRALVSGLINAQEEERRAVAYDLHDGLTQYVMAAHMHLESFRIAGNKGNTEKAHRELERGIHYLKESVLESRRLVNGLRSLALDDLGLAGAAEQLINEEKERSGWSDVEFVHNIADRRFSRDLETSAYRIVQEALTNVRKHANASRVRVLVLLGDDAGCQNLTVEVRDWGQGFNPSEKTGDYRHLGLQGMIERTSLMGGRYHIDSSPGQGTVINAVFPVDNAGTGGMPE